MQKRNEGRPLSDFVASLIKDAAEAHGGPPASDAKVIFGGTNNTNIVAGQVTIGHKPARATDREPRS